MFDLKLSHPRHTTYLLGSTCNGWILSTMQQGNYFMSCREPTSHARRRDMGCGLAVEVAALA